MKDQTRKEAAASTVRIKSFIEEMKVNRMYELPDNRDFKWAMVEHNDFGYCWTMGCKGMCTTIFSTDDTNNIKYWSTETEAKSDLIHTISKVAN